MIDFLKNITPIEILSRTSTEQIKYLIKLGTYPSTDELALQFDDSYSKLKERFNTISKEIENLNYLLNELNNKGEEIWNIESLNSPEWEEIRKLSTNILIKIKKNK